MFDERIKKAFEECEAFIDVCTPEELREYERSLELDYENYDGGITFSEYMNPASEIMCQSNENYSNVIKTEPKGNCVLQNSKLCVAA